MKTMFFAFQILLGLATAQQSLAQTCDQKHRQATAELIQVVQTIPNAKVKNLLLNGENSRIDIYSLSFQEQSEMQGIGQRYTPRMQQILAQPRCASTVRSVENIKYAIQNNNMKNALMFLNSEKGLNGLARQLDRVAGIQKPTSSAPGQPVATHRPGTPVVTPTPAVPRPQQAPIVVLQPRPIQRPVPAPVYHQPAAPTYNSEVVSGDEGYDGYEGGYEQPQYSNGGYAQPQYAQAAPQYAPAQQYAPRPSRPQYHQGYDNGGLRPNISLTSYQWQRVADGRARIIDGYYYHYGSPNHRCENSETYTPWGCEGL